MILNNKFFFKKLNNVVFIGGAGLVIGGYNLINLIEINKKNNVKSIVITSTHQKKTVIEI